MIAMGWIALEIKNNNYDCKSDGGVSCINGFFVLFTIAIGDFKISRGILVLS